MKKIIFLMLTAIVVVTFSCKDDDDVTNDPVPTTKTNSLKVNGTDYPLAAGFLINYGETDPGIYQMDINLISSGIIIHESNGQLDSASGTGNVIYFGAFSSSPTDIGVGTYQFDSLNVGVTKWSYGDYALNYNAQIQDDSLFQALKSGTITVAKTGSTYEISYSGTDENGKTITAYFKGSMKAYDMSSGKGLKFLH